MTLPFGRHALDQRQLDLRLLAHRGGETDPQVVVSSYPNPYSMTKKNTMPSKNPASHQVPDCGLDDFMSPVT